MILQGDCLELMKDIPDKSIDMILCDLPYGTTACKWDVIIPFEPLWEQYERIIKDNGAIVLTASQPFTSQLVMSNPKMFKYNWVWIKQIPTNHMNAKIQPMRSTEDVCVFYKNQCIYNPILSDKPQISIRSNTNIKIKQSNNGVFGQCRDYHNRHEFRVIPINKNYPVNALFIDAPSKNQRLHPTQKPVALFEYLIKTYTNEGEIVLDNCAGSGTTAVACINTNRNYIVMEKEEKYFEIIKKRVTEAENKKGLFKEVA